MNAFKWPKKTTTAAVRILSSELYSQVNSGSAHYADLNVILALVSRITAVLRFVKSANEQTFAVPRDYPSISSTTRPVLRPILGHNV